MNRKSALIFILFGLLSWLCFHRVGEHYYAGWALELGSLSAPRRIHLAFLCYWAFFGTLAAVALTLGLSGLLRGRDFLDRSLAAGSDQMWVFLGGVAAFVFPLTIYALVLRGAPVADDESAYLFSAELLAQGRLWIESPPNKLFFDRQFMINDGHMYSQYFLGWPAFLAIGHRLGVAELVNPALAAFTVPAVFSVGRRLGGRFGGRIALILFASSPLLMTAAATRLAHTSCVFALAWLLYATLRSGDDDSPLWVHALVSVSFSAAFFIRPLTAVAFGTPLLVLWGWRRWRSTSEVPRWHALVAFAAPAAAFGALFLTINTLQNGSPFRVAYVAVTDYYRENGFRFTTHQEMSTHTVPMGIDPTERGVASLGAAVMRLNATMFGWPSSFLLAVCAWTSTRARLFWWIVVSFFGVNLFVRNVGFDAFGPVHYTELTLAFIFLSVLGVCHVRKALESHGRKQWMHIPLVALVVLVVLSVLGYNPVRFAALKSSSGAVNIILNAPAREGLERAVVFAPTPFVARCAQRPTMTWVFFRPNNDPGLTNDVLWVNHINLQEDLAFMRDYPDREGWLAAWDPFCKLSLIPLEEAAREAAASGGARQVPPAAD